MISRAHAVSLRNSQVGVLAQSGDVARFSFDADYWERENRDVLGLWFEDNPRASPRATLRLPAWFSNLLPEGRLREWIAIDRNVSAEREMELLLRVGRDLPGAVTVAEDGAEGMADAWGDIENPRANPVESPIWKFSLAGVGLKFSMLASGDKLSLPAEHEFGDWIVKLPEPSHRNVPENEFLIMNLARAAGIEVPETRLVHRSDLERLPDNVWPNGEEYAFAIRRFDRADGERVHIEDLAQVRGFYPHEKYSGSFETVAALLYRGVDLSSLDEFVRRMTFNLLVGNGDAHLKNWSVIYEFGRRARISPAYDLVSTIPYFASGEEDLGLKFGGQKRFSAVTRFDFERMAKRLGVGQKSMLAIVDEVIERVLGEVGGLAPLTDLPQFPRKVEDHATAIAAQLGVRPNTVPIV
ncbi:type II toxin-antitoxin system HipA family toxin [Leifsonia sp. AG29]|uniref:type II toxin-antitoxin system HipA family toxin n=1 Tax=Leifsonia sp. AG29 TaxID=2598860 RepID=UPI002278BFC9|nr:type II toxin-antitoxin system HipA family toxin [Leifsonia sp. AG29]